MSPIDAAAPATHGTESLLRLINEQSVAEVAQLRAQTEERRRRIQAAAAAEAESFRAAGRAEGEERGRRQAAKALALAEAESHRQLLWAREALIEEVVGQARQRGAVLSATEGVSAIVTDLIREGLEALPPGTVRVRLPPDCERLLDRTIRDGLGAGRWVLTFIADPGVSGGVILETEDARLCFDNTFDARIRRRAQHLRRLVIGALLPEEGAEW